MCRFHWLFVCVLSLGLVACGGGGGKNKGGEADAGGAGGDGGGAGLDGGLSGAVTYMIEARTTTRPTYWGGPLTEVNLYSAAATSAGFDVDNEVELSTDFVQGWHTGSFTDEYTRPRVSPTGNPLAYVVMDTGELYLVPVNGSEDAVQVGSSGGLTEYRWAPDGSVLAVWRGGDLVFYNPDGSEARDAGSLGSSQSGDIAWAADSSALIYRNIPPFSSERHIVAVSVADSVGTDLTPAGDGGYSVAINADGSRVAFQRGTNVYVADLDGSNETMVAAGELPVGDPTGQRFAYTDGNDVYVVGFDGASPVRVRQGAAVTTVYRKQSWAPDGGHLVFREGGHLFLADPTTADGATDLGVGDFPSWSPDGAGVFYTDDLDAGVLKVAAAESGVTGTAYDALTPQLRSLRPGSEQAVDIEWLDNNAYRLLGRDGDGVHKLDAASYVLPTGPADGIPIPDGLLDLAEEHRPPSTADVAWEMQTAPCLVHRWYGHSEDTVSCIVVFIPVSRNSDEPPDLASITLELYSEGGKDWTGDLIHEDLGGGFDTAAEILFGTYDY